MDTKGRSCHLSRTLPSGKQINIIPFMKCLTGEERCDPSKNPRSRSNSKDEVRTTPSRLQSANGKVTVAGHMIENIDTIFRFCSVEIALQKERTPSSGFFAEGTFAMQLLWSTFGGYSRDFVPFSYLS